MGTTPARGASAAPAPVRLPAAVARAEAKRKASRAREHPVKPFLLWAFYGFIFSLPLEMIQIEEIGVKSGHLTISRIIGYIFIFLSLFQPRVCFRRPPKILWIFGIYLGIYISFGLMQETRYQSTILQRAITLTQMLVLLWISYSLMRYPRIARGTIWMLALSCSLLGILQATGVTSQSFGKVERVGAIGANVNTVGSILSLGLLSLIGLLYAQGKGAVPQKGAMLIRLFAWPLFAVMGAQLVLTGSRGPVVALSAGFLAFMLRSGSAWIKIRNTAIVLLALGGFAWYSYQSETARLRWESTIQGGSLGKREEIFPVAWEMFMQKPLIGWGPVAYLSVLGAEEGLGERETHNLFLGVLVEVGLIGAIPYFIGLGMCLRAGWRARRGPQGILPFALLLALMTINMSSTWHNRKLHWLVLAYALASATQVVRTRRRVAVQLPLPGSRSALAQYRRSPVAPV